MEKGLALKKSSTYLITSVLSVVFVMMVSLDAFSISFEMGKVKGSFDTTASVGARWRVEDRDPRLIGIANGGEGLSVNGDDGNINYGKTITNLATKLSHELSFDYKNKYGVFLRGFYFYDSVTTANDFEKKLTDQARAMSGKDGKLLDAYAYANFEAGNTQIEVRLGNQVLNWGESTFFLNGLNLINPIDVSRLRVPGAEIKDALTPVSMAWVGMGFGSLSLQAFYQVDWEETIIDPRGTYFSTTDALSRGGDRLYLGYGSAPDSTPLGANAVVPRTTTRTPDDEGQFGLSLSWFLPDGNTEMGLYYMNIHSRLPVVSGVTGTVAGAIGGDYVGSSKYFTEYPEDIKIAGLSFNTQIGSWSVQGEISHKMDVPAQVDDNELLFALLCPPGGPTLNVPANAFLCAQNQLGNFADQFATEISGFKKIDMSQISLSTSRSFSQTKFWDQLFFLAEVGAINANIEKASELRYEAAGTPTSANAAMTTAGVQPETTDEDFFPDEFSWGYRLLAITRYNNAIGNVSLSPRISFNHDVEGTSPAPYGNFVADRKSFSFSLSADYQSKISATLSYASFFGADARNTINDRDFVSFEAKYYF